MKYYRNLGEVERDIEISKLRADIEQEKLKLRANAVKRSFSRQSLLQNLFMETGKRISFAAVINALRPRRERKRAKGRS